MDKLEIAKALIADIDALRRKYGIDEVILLTIVEGSLMPTFIQDDPGKDSAQKVFMGKLYASIVEVLRSGATDLTMHTKTQKGDWDDNKLV